MPDEVPASGQLTFSLDGVSHTVAVPEGAAPGQVYEYDAQHDRLCPPRPSLPQAGCGRVLGPDDPVARFTSSCLTGGCVLCLECLRGLGLYWGDERVPPLYRQEMLRLVPHADPHERDGVYDYGPSCQTPQAYCEMHAEHLRAARAELGPGAGLPLHTVSPLPVCAACAACRASNPLARDEERGVDHMLDMYEAMRRDRFDEAAVRNHLRVAEDQDQDCLICSDPGAGDNHEPGHQAPGERETGRNIF